MVQTNFSSMMKLKCPRCRQGNIFIHQAFHPKFSSINENCPVCNLKFEIEPGFFWGSMYISYAITVAIGLPLAILTYYLLNDPAVWVYLLILVGLLLILSPLTFRYSRIFMLYWFGNISYDKKYQQ